MGGPAVGTPAENRRTSMAYVEGQAAGATIRQVCQASAEG